MKIYIEEGSDEVWYRMEDRFSLLLLEPGEIYFTDVGVTYCKDPDFKENRKHPASPKLTNKSKDIQRHPSVSQGFDSSFLKI